MSSNQTNQHHHHNNYPYKQPNGLQSNSSTKLIPLESSDQTEVKTQTLILIIR